MAVLTIRNLPDEVHASLRVRAAHRGRSMEAEARAILEDAVAERIPGTSLEELRDWVRQTYAGERPQSVVDDLIADRRREAANE